MVAEMCPTLVTHDKKNSNQSKLSLKAIVLVFNLLPTHAYSKSSTPTTKLAHALKKITISNARLFLPHCAVAAFVQPLLPLQANVQFHIRLKANSTIDFPHRPLIAVAVRAIQPRNSNSTLHFRSLTLSLARDDDGSVGRW